MDNMVFGDWITCFFVQGGLGRALDNTANDFLKATSEVSRDFSNAVTSNPLVIVFAHV